jgi:thymidine kinase
MGGIQLIIGPMFSGKTTELFRMLNRWKIAGRNCVLVKHSSDCRYVEDEDSAPMVISHDGNQFPAICVEKLSKEIDYLFGSYNVIGIDEGQFVSKHFFLIFVNILSSKQFLIVLCVQFPGIALFADRMANRGKWIIISALNGSGKAGFRNVHSLMSLCENITFLRAVCMICRDHDGIFTLRRNSKKVI